jgi:hypothetical protein
MQLDSTKTPEYEASVRKILATLATRAKTKADPRSSVPLDLLTVDDNGRQTRAIDARYWTPEGAIALARVHLADLSSRTAVGKAARVLGALATVKVDPDSLRASLLFERGTIRREVAKYDRASERFALAGERIEDQREARRYNTVGAAREMSAADVYVSADAIRVNSEAECRAHNLREDTKGEQEDRERRARAEDKAHERALAFALQQERGN